MFRSSSGHMRRRGQGEEQLPPLGLEAAPARCAMVPGVSKTLCQMLVSGRVRSNSGADAPPSGEEKRERDRGDANRGSWRLSNRRESDGPADSIRSKHRYTLRKNKTKLH